MNKGKILVIGSICFDMTFNIYGQISDKVLIEDSKVKKLDLMFTAGNLNKQFGGTAGNIAYGLAQLGVSPLMFGIVGDDYNETYRKHIENLGIEDISIHEEGAYTATFYAMSDESKEIIGVFQPNSHGNFERYDLSSRVERWSDIVYVMFAPSTANATVKHMKEAKKKNSTAKLIFDPGQIVNLYSKKQMITCLDLADIIVGNEVEIPLIAKISGRKIDEMIDNDGWIIIETRGEKGVNVYTKEGEEFFQADPAEKFIEATGAGDAFRAGLLYGLIERRDLRDSVNIGMKMGAKKVGSVGGQGYKITKEEI